MDKLIGSIYAYIAGDTRYGSFLSVSVDKLQLNATVQLHENGAVGGMDGPGGATPWAVTRTLVCKATPAEIVKALKRVINDERPSVIKAYGKPTKRFYWAGVGVGMSAKLAKAALEHANEHADGES